MEKKKRGRKRTRGPKEYKNTKYNYVKTKKTVCSLKRHPVTHLELDEATEAELALQARVELARRAAKEDDVLQWGEALFPDKFTLSFCRRMHPYFVEIMNEPFTCTEAPREFGKTIIKCFLIPLYLALEKPFLYKHFLNIQSTSTKAIAINISIKHEIESNRALRMLYGDLISSIKWTEKQFVLAKTDTRPQIIFTGVGAGESIRGINFDNIRPDYLMADDLYDDNHIYNIEATKKINQWFWSTLYPARASTKNNCIHITGTAINKADLMYELKHKKLETIDIKKKTFQAIIDATSKTVLWPSFRSYEALMDEKELMGVRAFNRERMNVRGSSEESIIKEIHVQYYDEIPEGKQIVRKIGTCDPSIGAKEHNDYTAMAAIYVVKIPNVEEIFDYYIEDLVNEHLSLNQRIIQLENFDERHEFNEFRIEAIAGFKDFVSEAKRRTNIPIKEIDSVKDKITNLERESAKFENGRVFIKRSINPKLRNLLVEQLIDNYPAHDDLRDAVLLGLKEKGKKKVTVS